MKPVRPGDRGPAVEDIQRRLLCLGFDLGPTGVDGVYLGATEVAVRTFQADQRIIEDGYVGEDTWAALVDATFTLGDRMLYLRLPHFHGNDVRVAQEALNSLGFTCGSADGIFGAYSERAVREFQRNAGLPSDGILGPETVGAIRALRHVWEGKDNRPHSGARLEPARASHVLAGVAFAVSGLDESGKRVAGRLVNLALAAEPDARIALLESGEEPRSPVDAFLQLRGQSASSAPEGSPLVRMTDLQTFVGHLALALHAADSGCRPVVVDMELGRSGVERDEQRAAVMLLDALCVAFD